jgi:nitrogen regulatory protein P-II 2
MNTVRMKRITMIGDCTVQYRLLKEVKEFGATGYTWFAANGQGDRGIRPRHAEPANAKIEVITTPEVADRILEHVARNYFDEYAMIAFLDDVEVVRGEKYTPKNPGKK